MKPAVLQSKLQTFIHQQAPEGKLIVAFSGGLDSSVLLHALCAVDPTMTTRLLAVHINHQLQSQAGLWEKHCRRFALNLNVAFVSEKVCVEASSNIEELARQARYQALFKHVQAADVLLTAHHQNDQAETVLLNLLRGSGVEGLAAMSEKSVKPSGVLLRPLLTWSRETLEQYAADTQLQWIEDPSNQDERFTRNFVRQRLMPLLQERWPQAVPAISRSAQNCQELLTFSHPQLERFLSRCSGKHPHMLSVSALLTMSVTERQLVIRHWLKSLQVEMPDRQKLQFLAGALLNAGGDSQPQLQWSGHQVRRFGEYLFYLPMTGFNDMANASPVWRNEVSCYFELGMPAGRLEVVFAHPLQKELGCRLRVSFRQFGDKHYLKNRAGGRKLKKLLQDWQVPVWLRDYVPLLYLGNECLTIGDFAHCQHSDRVTVASVRWHLPAAWEWR